MHVGGNLCNFIHLGRLADKKLRAQKRRRTAAEAPLNRRGGDRPRFPRTDIFGALQLDLWRYETSPFPRYSGPTNADRGQEKLPDGGF